jgi:hypothetical protein
MAPHSAGGPFPHPSVSQGWGDDGRNRDIKEEQAAMRDGGGWTDGRRMVGRRAEGDAGTNSHSVHRLPSGANPGTRAGGSEPPNVLGKPPTPVAAGGGSAECTSRDDRESKPPALEKRAPPLARRRGDSPNPALLLRSSQARCAARPPWRSGGNPRDQRGHATRRRRH